MLRPSSLLQYSFMFTNAVAVAGFPAQTLLSYNVSQSRLSSSFIQRHVPSAMSTTEVHTSVSVCLQLSSFTCVLRFAVDCALHGCDAILGLDWYRKCEAAEMLHLCNVLTHFDGLLEPLQLPESMAFASALHQCDAQDENNNNNNKSFDINNHEYMHIVNNDVCESQTRESYASSSHIVSEHRDVRPGSSYLDDFLLHRHTSGLTISPFLDNVDLLRKSLMMHGISLNGLSIEKYRSVLLRHIFGGGCVLCPDNNDHTACHLFARGFGSARDMSRAAFHIVSTGKVSTDELLSLLQALEISTKFRRSKLRSQIIRELNKQSNVFATAVTAGEEFIMFEKLDKAALLAIASSHGVATDMFTSSREDLKSAILTHFAQGECCSNMNNVEHITSRSMCSQTVNSVFENMPSRDVANAEIVRKQFIVKWLGQQQKKLARNPLMRLLQILEIDFDNSEDTRTLRSYLKKFISSVRNKMNLSEHNSSIEERLQRIRSQWPTIVPDRLKDKIIGLFREQTNSDSHMSVSCASCAEACLLLDTAKIKLSDINLGVLDKRDTEYHINGPISSAPCPSQPDIIVTEKGLSIDDDTGELFVTLCKLCHSSIRSNKLPPLALANDMILGNIPHELADLTVVEEAMIAQCRAKCWVIQLKEEHSELMVPNAQRGVRGHIIIYPQRPSAIATILPPSLEEVSTPICVVFVGASPPSKEWLQQKAKPLVVRREKVRSALIWLKKHNPLYQDIVINEEIINSFPSESTLPVHIEHVLPCDDREALTARYDNSVTLMPMSNDNSGEVSGASSIDTLFEKVVIADVNGNASTNELRAAAIRHMKKNNGGYIEIPHDPTPVNEFCNPALFPLIYPTLFPYGIGGFEDPQRRVRVSLKRHAKHLFSLTDRRFQEHYSFLFTVFNILQRREILLRCSLKVKRRNFESIAKTFANVSANAIHVVTERVARGDWVTSNSTEERQVLNLMREVNVLTSHVPGSAASRVAMRNEIRGLMIDKGLPNFYLTINPADVYNPLVKFLAGSEVDIDNLQSEDVPDYWNQSILIAKNPAVAAKFFNIYMKAFISTILKYDPKQCDVEGGAFGVVNAYYGCVEAQGRGSLHCHMLVWVEGGLNVDEIKKRVLAGDEEGKEFSKRLVAFLDDTISNCIPTDPDPLLSVPSSEHHPCSVRGLHCDDIGRMSPDQLKKAREKDMHQVVKQCQSHIHTATCYKYWRGAPHVKECRFDLDPKNLEPKSYFDDRGNLNLRKLDGMVNNFNATTIEAMRCNMDIKFIGSGPSAKAVIYYITDYISKTQLKSHVAFAALELAVKKLDERTEKDDDMTMRAKKLLQKCAFTMVAHQELSAQQVCSYLMDYGDHYTSHEYKNIYWTAFERFINDEMPSPECYKSSSLTINDEGYGDKAVDANTIDTFVEVESDDKLNDAIDIEEVDNIDDEITISVSKEGGLVARTGQVLDYQQRSELLNDLTLWDAIAQAEKVRKYRSRRESNGDYADETHEECYDDDHEGYIEVATHLSSKSRQRPKYDLLPDHPDHMSHMLRIRSCANRFVPVPIGPSIPRRDRENDRERYCRLMLIFFKPWRHAHDLREHHECWSEAFLQFMETCSDHRAKIMDNMQLLHECKDSRDDHFTGRRTRDREHVPVDGQSVQQRTEYDFGAGDDYEAAILEHLESIESVRSDTVKHAREDVVTCLHHAESGGLFGAYDIMHVHEAEDVGVNEEVSEHGTSLDILWNDAYQQRREEWKRKEQVSSADLQDESHISSSLLPAVRSAIDARPLRVPNIHRKMVVNNEETGVDMENIVTEFSLNHEQARAFRIVALHSCEIQPKPLRMFLGGAGGTGKSRVINALQFFFDRRKQCRRFRLSSYTGVAANNISGITLHAALCLNQRNTKTSSAKTKRDLIAMWEGVDYLFVDEVSMIGCRLMLKISEALNDAKQNNLPFGGINIVFAGDFAQLPPVGDARLFSKINTYEVKTLQGQQNVFGKLLWLSVKTVVILTEVMRQSGEGNIAFVRLLNRLSQGMCSDADYNLLHTRVLKNLKVALHDNQCRYDPIVVSSNEVKDALNERATEDFALKTGRELQWYYSVDNHANKLISDDLLINCLGNMHSGKTNQRLGKVPLVLGMPLMICRNYDVEGGIVNGCIGSLQKIRYWVDAQGRRHAVSCEIKTSTTTAPVLPMLDHQHVVALRDTVDIRFVHPYSMKSCIIKRTQLPVVPAFAMTAHKAQGQTMNRAIVDLQGCHGTEAPYVMLSRVKSLEGLIILRPFEKRKIQCRQSEDSRREAKRMDFLRLQTIVVHGDVEEISNSQQLLSSSPYEDRSTILDNHHEEEMSWSQADSVQRLKDLQDANQYVTSGRPISESITGAIDSRRPSHRSSQLSGSNVNGKRSLEPVGESRKRPRTS